MTPATPRLATTVLLVRDRGGLEVLMVVRNEKPPFSSALVFPGGIVDPEDSHEDWLPHTTGAADLPVQERAIRIAGFRELYEETGVLLVDAAEPVLASAPSSSERTFLETVAQTGAKLDLEAMHPFAHWITPEVAPKRYDTHFRICGLDTGLTAVSDGLETVSVEWLSPKDAMDLGAAGERNVLFPTRSNLQLLANSTSVEEAIDAARRRTIVTVMPKIVKRPEGTFVTLPPDSGYGEVEQRTPDGRPA
jgi:8-oxo-dGTP pyrophosphatase MutT (NUDIX family)